ncbi:MAG TPA: DUF488 domain-containing protein [Patescibacteria group bacterium]|nr:DUF488 domain-containing protein [Patescibacteria group bacterium]
MEVYTIGHTTRSTEDFINVLKAYDIEIVVDVRTVPKSRHNPQFEGMTLERSLEEVGISYIHIPELGGLRNPKKDSQNMEWRNTSFRGYADYMETDEFNRGIEMLKKIAENHKVVIMCAEAVPWRCHRNLIADRLVVDGWEVEHIITETSSSLHKLTEFLKVVDGNLTYPKE